MALLPAVVLPTKVLFSRSHRNTGVQVNRRNQAITLIDPVVSVIGSGC
jgi:hypothetical protein